MRLFVCGTKEKDWACDPDLGGRATKIKIQLWSYQIAFLKANHVWLLENQICMIS